MLGRVAYHDPMLLAAVDGRFFGSSDRAPEFGEVVAAMADYAERQMGQGVRLNQISRHMLGLANGRPGARRFRQLLSVEAARRDARPSLLFEALEAVEALPAAAE